MLPISPGVGTACSLLAGMLGLAPRLGSRVAGINSVMRGSLGNHDLHRAVRERRPLVDHSRAADRGLTAQVRNLDQAEVVDAPARRRRHRRCRCRRRRYDRRSLMRSAPTLCTLNRASILRPSHEPSVGRSPFMQIEDLCTLVGDRLVDNSTLNRAAAAASCRSWSRR